MGIVCLRWVGGKDGRCGGEEKTRSGGGGGGGGRGGRGKDERVGGGGEIARGTLAFALVFSSSSLPAVLSLMLDCTCAGGGRCEDAEGTEVGARERASSTRRFSLNQVCTKLQAEALGVRQEGPPAGI